ncbi:MAG: RIP metalloprotease RseP [Gammaproteobacteria bacterium]|nr:RIP metalloprotease RseP [Gammaproteobacteria bacterium]
MTVLWSVLGFIVVMGLIVTIHEWGHYQVARWFNIKVTTFSIGFGKSLYEKQGSETTFKIGIIPLGGYVKFVDEREGEVSEADLPRAFNRQSVYKRFAVVAAGPIINLLFAWFVFSVMYLVGVSGPKPIFDHVNPASPLSEAFEKQSLANNQTWSVVSVDGRPVYHWQGVHQQILQGLVDEVKSIDLTLESQKSGGLFLLKDIPLDGLDINQPKQNWLKVLGFKPYQIQLPIVLGDVVPQSAAALAGLKSGDKILRVGSETVTYWPEFVTAVRAKPEQAVEITYERDHAEYVAVVKLGKVQLSSGQSVGQFGASVQVSEAVLKPYMNHVQYGVSEAFLQGFQRSLDLFDMSLVMMQRMFFGNVSLENLSGPLSIANYSGQAIQSGLISFLSLLGLLSLSIGILNLLPIPILDGGHLVYYLIEMVKGSPVSERVMSVGQSIGLALIVGLTFVALFNDVVRISHG